MSNLSINPISIIRRLLGEAPRSRLFTVLGLNLFGAALESFGLMFLVPMLETISSGFALTKSNNTVISALQKLSNTFTLETFLLVFFVLVIMRALVAVARARISTHLQLELVDQIRRRCYQALLHANWRWLVAGRRSDHASTLMNGISHISNGLYFCIQLIGTLILLLAYLFAAFLLSWQASVICVVTGAVIFVLLKRLRTQALQLGQQLSDSERDLMGNVQESLSGIKLAKILGAENSYIEKFDRSMQLLRQENIAFQVNHTRANAWYQVIGALLLAFFLYISLTILKTPTANLVTLIFIFSRMLPMFSSAQQQWQQCLHALPSIQHSYELITLAEAASEPQTKEVLAFPRIQQALELQNATVRYSGRNIPALDGINLRLQSKTTTAIMGESGAGKSTLADALMGLIHLDAGTLRVDGIAIEGELLQSWRHCVSYVPQDVFLFHDSIRNNLLWGNLQASDEELRQSLQRAAAEFVFDLPNGLETRVGDGGILLSGGERQRIALARALLKKPALLILDEATSALDVQNEMRIRQAIENLHGNLTVLIIGHRLPTLEHADQVILLANGKIKTQGTWNEITARL